MNWTRQSLSRIAARAAGGALGIALMETLASLADAPLMTVPFATSIVLVMGAPESPPAVPRAILGGHVVSALAGVLCTMVLGDALWVSAVGVGLAIAAMQALDVFHPPAGINPIIVTTAHATHLFVLFPVATGALILIAFAWAYHRTTSSDAWPERWL